MEKKIAFLCLIFLINTYDVFSQGCSDAGFCTMGNLKPQSDVDTTYKHSASLSLSYGIGEQNTTIVLIIPELEFEIFKNNSIQIKIPYISVSGNLGENSGVGDISFSITQILKETENTKLNLTLGFKIPAGATDKETTVPVINPLVPFPMPYQTGLGTTDLILGASMKCKMWNLALGFQGILSNGNKNEFLKSSWFVNADAQKYFESNQLRRGNDALLRIERRFDLKKITLSFGVLNIIHLQESSIIDSTGNRVGVKGSDGLTVNVTGTALYEISKRTLLNFSFGFPTIVRDARPDGLTRKLVLTAGIKYQFGK